MKNYVIVQDKGGVFTSLQISMYVPAWLVFIPFPYSFFDFFPPTHSAHVFHDILEVNFFPTVKPLVKCLLNSSGSS